MKIERIAYQGALDRAATGAKCEATCTDRTTAGRSCPSSALYRVNGVAMCRRHAGSVVLDHLAPGVSAQERREEAILAAAEAIRARRSPAH